MIIYIINLKNKNFRYFKFIKILLFKCCLYNYIRLKYIFNKKNIKKISTKNFFIKNIFKIYIFYIIIKKKKLNNFNLSKLDIHQSL